MNLKTEKNSIFFLWLLALLVTFSAALLTGAYAQEEDRGFVGGGGYAIYQCPSVEESVARLSYQGRQSLRDMCLEDTDVEDCVHKFLRLPSGCKIYLRTQDRFYGKSFQLEGYLRTMGNSREVKEAAQFLHQKAIRKTSGK